MYKRRIANIVSMRNGLPAFTYREIAELKRLGTEVDCFIMRDGKGPYMPEPDWNTVNINKSALIAAVLGFIIKNPSWFFKTLAVAIKDVALLHFLIAVYYIGYLRKLKTDVIYCNEGKHALWIGYYCHLYTKLPMTVLVHAEMITGKEKIPLTKKAADKCYKIIICCVFEINKNVKKIRQFFWR